MATVLLVNIVAVTLLYPTLKVTTFDPRFAMALGIRTGAVNAAFMFLVSVTVTAAFHAAGAILVIALMVAPPATAHLLTRRLADRKSTRLNSSHVASSYAVFCLKKKRGRRQTRRSLAR